MSIKKFLAPNALIAIILATVWASGIDSVFVSKVTDQDNIRKYISIQSRIVDNYVEPVDLNLLFKDSIKGFVSNLSDSTMELGGTPLDTTFPGINITSLRESVLNFERAYRYLKAKNPNEEMEKRTEDAIFGMFDHLDPHSTYFEPQEGDRIREQFAGKFQGIGVQFDIIKDTIIVVTALIGGPSEKLGIQSGDRIIAIDGNSSIGFTNNDVVNNLRGPKGSTVDVTVLRPTSKETIVFSIVRDDIPLYTVEASYMLDNKTGYIKISRFAATTYDEFMTAVKDLKKSGMERIVLDLRNNSGGYMDQSIKMTNEFFPREVKIVSQQSRHAQFNSEYYSYSHGQLQNEDLIVLVNEGSASASEIVSGAIQDNDRGLIVGARTYGKGLVQQQYELPDGSGLRVTISRYYTPSGRLIQKPYTNGREQYAYELMRRPDDPQTDAKEFIKNVPDSLKFYTRFGRPVYAGGGILPDHIVENDTTTSYLFGFMRRKRATNDFVMNYVDKHGDEFRAKWGEKFDAFRSDFSWSTSERKEFNEILFAKGLVFTDTLAKARYTTKYDSLLINPTQFESEEWIVENYLKAELATRIWGPQSFWPVFNDHFDKTLEKAMTMWPEVEALKGYAEKAVKVEGRG